MYKCTFNPVHKGSLAIIVIFLVTFGIQEHQESIKKDGNREKHPKTPLYTLKHPTGLTPPLGKISLVVDNPKQAYG